MQQGSRVAFDGLRFDFSHFNALTPEQCVQVEKRVNQKIWNACLFSTKVMKFEDAQASGATALFG
jgi:alanyl-tRNA synthetase